MEFDNIWKSVNELAKDLSKISDLDISISNMESIKGYWFDKLIKAKNDSKEAKKLEAQMARLGAIINLIQIFRDTEETLKNV